jgi:hypothetical protein
MDAWISPEIAPWFSFFSLTSVGATLAVFVRRGEHRALVTAVWSAMALVGVVMLAGFLAGAAMGQPWYVLIALGVPGVVLSLVYGWSVARLGKAYSASELRRTMAKDI